MKILVINCGSSSLKYQLLDMEGEKLLAKGLCERIGIDGHLTHKKTVQRLISSLMKKQVIERKGSNKSGSWTIKI